MVAYMQNDLGQWCVPLPPYHYPHQEEVSTQDQAHIQNNLGQWNVPVPPFNDKELNMVTEVPQPAVDGKSLPIYKKEEKAKKEKVYDEEGHSRGSSLYSDYGKDEATVARNAKVRAEEEEKKQMQEITVSATIKPTGEFREFRPLEIPHVMGEIEIRFPIASPGNTPKFHAVRYAPGYEYIMDKWFITHTTFLDKLQLTQQAGCHDWCVTLERGEKKHLWDKIGGVHFNRTTTYFRTLKDSQGQDEEVEAVHAKQKDRPVIGSRDTWMLHAQSFPRNAFWRSRWTVLGYAYHRNEDDDAEDEKRIARGEPPRDKSATEVTGSRYSRWNHRDPYTFEGQNADGTWGGAAGPSVSYEGQLEANKRARKERKKRAKAKKAAEKQAKKDEKQAKKDAKKAKAKNKESGEIEMDTLPPAPGRSDGNSRAEVVQSGALAVPARARLRANSEPSQGPPGAAGMLARAKTVGHHQRNVTLARARTIGHHGPDVMPAMPADEPAVEADEDPYGPAYHYKHERILGIFRRAPEKVKWDLERVALFEEMFWNGRAQPPREDDWMVIFHDGQSHDPSVMKRDFRVNMEIWTRNKRGLDAETFGKLATALLEHDSVEIKEQARRLKPLPSHHEMPGPKEDPPRQTFVGASIRRLGHMVRPRASMARLASVASAPIEE